MGPAAQTESVFLDTEPRLFYLISWTPDWQDTVLGTERETEKQGESDPFSQAAYVPAGENRLCIIIPVPGRMQSAPSEI